MSSPLRYLRFLLFKTPLVAAGRAVPLPVAFFPRSPPQAIDQKLDLYWTYGNPAQHESKRDLERALGISKQGALDLLTQSGVNKLSAAGFAGCQAK